MFFFEEKGWRFDLWAVRFDILELFDGAKFVVPVLGRVRDSSGPLDGVVEDEFEYAVGATLPGFLVGECAWDSWA